jgi:OTU domain-containing protein 6
MTASPPPAPEGGTTAETLEQMQARHRKELKDLQGRITNKKKNATKKTRKFVNDECAEMERQLRERQEQEVRRLLGQDEDEAQEDGVDGVNGVDGPIPDQKQEEEISSKLSATHLSSSQ